MTKLNVCYDGRYYAVDLDDSIYKAYLEVKQGKIKYPCGSEKELMDHVWRIEKYLDDYIRKLAKGEKE